MRLQRIVLVTTLLLTFATTSSAQWQSVRKGLPDGISIVSLAASGNRLFVGTANRGAYYSDDVGASWTYCSFPDSQRYGFSYNTAKFFASGPLLFVSAAYEFFVSSDNGNSWQWDTNGFNASDGKENVSAFGSDSSNIYLGTMTGLFVSSSNGGTWSRITGDLPNGYVPERIGSVKGSVFVAGNNPSLIKSSDHGTQWKVIENIPPLSSGNAITTIGSTLFVGGPSSLYATQDLGDTWTRKSSPPSYFMSLISEGQLLICGTLDSGAFISDDLGSSFKSAGLPHARVNSLCTLGGYLFAGTDQSDGTYSSDQGVWRRPLSELSNASVNIEPEPQFSVSPNPATNFVTVSQVGHVTVTNMLGVSVLDVNSQDRSNLTLDVSRLLPGAYFVRRDGSATLQKLIKN
jgi:photosystem II stability/assembly factor-like uncharacterized protein